MRDEEGQRSWCWLRLSLGFLPLGSGWFLTKDSGARPRSATRPAACPGAKELTGLFVRPLQKQRLRRVATTCRSGGEQESGAVEATSTAQTQPVVPQVAGPLHWPRWGYRRPADRGSPPASRCGGPVQADHSSTGGAHCFLTRKNLVSCPLRTGLGLVHYDVHRPHPARAQRHLPHCCCSHRSRQLPLHLAQK